MASKNVVIATDETFDQEVLRSDKPVLVDFTAAWCGPCRALAPVIDRIADESEGKVKVVKVDIDDSPHTAQRYGIRGVPTVMAFNKGERTGQHVGLTNKETLLRLVS